MRCPETIQDIDELIRSQVQESIHLDYKDGRALTGTHVEISKDVSAFANSDGGVIIYGVQESGHLPIGIEGVDHIVISRERLESMIQSNVSPPIADICIKQLPIDTARSIFAVCVKKSLRSPHQDRQSKRYYKRSNFQSVPMEDYEIQDIRNRVVIHPSLINVDFEVDRAFFIELVVQNVGSVGASDIAFKFNPELTWRRECPAALINGIKYLGKGKRLPFVYNTLRDTFAKDSTIVKAFEVDVSYFNSIVSQRISEVFRIDISDYGGASVETSELARHGTEIRDALMNLTREMQKMNRILEDNSSFIGPTGLNLSVTTLRQLASILSRPYVPTGVVLQDCTAPALKEILNISLEEAFHLHDYLRKADLTDDVVEVPGVSPETVQSSIRLLKNRGI